MFCLYLRKKARSASSLGRGVTGAMSCEPRGENRKEGRDEMSVPTGGSFRATFISVKTRFLTPWN